MATFFSLSSQIASTLYKAFAKNPLHAKDLECIRWANLAYLNFDYLEANRPETTVVICVPG